MEPRDKMKDVKSAINACMILMAAGIFTIINAILTIPQYGLPWFTISTAAEGGTVAADINASELLEYMESNGITVSDLRLLGTVCIIICVIRIAAGFVCVLFYNRVDKANITLKVVIGLGVCEVIYGIFLRYKKAMMFFNLLFALVIAGFLLWAALIMRDLQKAYPNRKYALERTRNTAKKAAAAPKKTIHDRAMINTPETAPDEKQVENPYQESAVVEAVPDVSSAEQQNQDAPTEE